MKDRLTFYQSASQSTVALYFVLAVLGNVPRLQGDTGFCAICTSYSENEEEGERSEKAERPETHKVQFSSGDVIYKLWVIFDEVKLAPGLLCILCSKCFRVLAKNCKPFI
jgi:hypothetical protein